MVGRDRAGGPGGGRLLGGSYVPAQLAEKHRILATHWLRLEDG